MEWLGKRVRGPIAALVLFFILLPLVYLQQGCKKESAGAEVQIKDGVLILYPDECIGQDGRVTLGPEVRSIGPGAFRNCARLRELLTAFIDTIGANAFAGCDNLERIIVPNDQPPYADPTAFHATPATMNLIVPQGQEELYIPWAGDLGIVWLNEKRVPRVVVTPDGEVRSFPDRFIPEDGELILDNLTPAVTSIGDQAFEGSSRLRSVVGVGVRRVGARAFAGCASLTMVHLPNAHSIDDNAFLRDSALVGLEVSRAERLGHFAFAGCTGLVHVSLPHVKYLGEGVFTGCRGLKEFEIGETLPEAASNTFVRTPGGKNLVVPASSFQVDLHEPWAAVHCFETINGVDVGVEAPPEGLIAEGRTIVAVSDIAKGMKFELIIPDYFKTIGRKVFSHKLNRGADLYRIIAHGIETVESEAFYMRDNLGEVRMNNLRVIGDLAFFGIRSRIDKFKWAPRVETIGRGAFSYCENLWFLDLPNVREIGHHAFLDCKKLRNEGVVHFGSPPPAILGSLGVKIPLLVVPDGSRAEYEAWSYRDQFGTIVEESEPGAKRWRDEMARGD